MNQEVNGDIPPDVPVMNGDIPVMNGHVVNYGDPEDLNSDAYVLSCDYIKFRLERENLNWPDCPELPAHPIEPCLLMRELGRDFENRRPQELSQLVHSLSVTPGTAYNTFLDVANGIFTDGTNWGRIVALYAFGGLLAIRCFREGMPGLVSNVADWIAIYTEAHLDHWINDHGGWAGMVEHFKRNNRDNGFFSGKLLAGVGVACAVVGAVTLGTILSSHK